MILSLFSACGEKPPKASESLSPSETPSEEQSSGPVFATLEIKYTNFLGSPLCDSYTTKIEVGQSFEVTSPIIDDYVTETPVVSGTMTKDGFYTSVIYFAESSTLEISYVDTQGNTIFPKHTDVYEYGEFYSVESPYVPFMKPNQARVSGYMKSNVSATVVYEFTEFPEDGVLGSSHDKFPSINLQTGFSLSYELVGVSSTKHQVASGIDFSICNGKLDAYVNGTYCGYYSYETASNPDEYDYTNDSVAKKDSSVFLTVSFNVDGSIKIYSDGYAILHFRPEEKDSSNKLSVKDFCKTVLNSINKNGITLKQNNLDEIIICNAVNDQGAYNLYKTVYKTLIINYLYENGTKAFGSITLQGKVNQSYDYPTKQLPGYTPSLQSVTGVLNKDKTINVIYKEQDLLLINYKCGDKVLGYDTRRSIEGNVYTVRPAQIPFYETKDTTKTVTAKKGLNVVDFNYNLSWKPIENCKAQSFSNLPSLDQSTGVSVSFYVKNINTDWQTTIFGKNFKIHLGCFTLYNNGNWWSDWYEGKHGQGNQNGNSWNAIVPYENEYFVTMSFNANGSITIYRNGQKVYLFTADTINTDNSSGVQVKTLTYTIIDELSKYGFTTENTNIRHLIVGSAVSDSDALNLYNDNK